MYGASISKIRKEDSRKVLAWIYSKIPPTTDGECCRNINQRMLYVEFLNAWHYALRYLKPEEFIFLMEKCLRLYMYGYKQIPDHCMFCDKASSLYLVKEHRPVACRISRSVFQKFEPAITSEQISSWEKMLYNAEKSLGISPSKIHSREGGTCRLFFEHVLLEVMGEDGLEMISNTNIVGSEEEKEAIIKKSLEGLRGLIDGAIKSKSSNS